MADEHGPGPLAEPMNQAYLWPLVLLTDLDEASQDKLAGSVQLMLKDDLKDHSKHYFGDNIKANSDVKIWSPSRWLLRSIYQQGPHRDCLGNIHALAVLAFRSGLPRIIVADEATKRHLAENRDDDCDLRRGISVILISTTCFPNSDRVSIFLKRAACFPVQDNAQRPVPTSDIQMPEFRSAIKYFGPLWDRGPRETGGFIVHDPDQELSMIGSAQILAREYYVKAVTAALRPHLPMELALEVSNTRSSQIKMPVWERRPSRTHLVIFCTYQTTTEELRKTQKVIQDGLSPVLNGYRTAELVPLDRHRIRTRRDLISFWEKYRLWDAYMPVGRGILVPLIYLSQPLKNISLVQFGVIQGRGTSVPIPTVMARMRLRDICEDMAKIGYINAPLPGDFDYDSSHEGPREFFWHPDQPCLTRQLPWIFSWLTIFASPPLTEEAKQRIQDIMTVYDKYGPHGLNGPHALIEARTLSGRNGEAGMTNDAGMTKEACMTNKAGLTDEQLEYVWNTVSRDYIERCSWTSGGLFAFIDEQFVVGQTVIVASVKQYVGDTTHRLLEHLPFPWIQGFFFKRVPVYLAAMCGKDTAVGGEWLSYSRPGWPSPGLLPDGF
ncbi:unnamed protein product [Penicillium egyptiacum]|uniref:Uncharacterized protein n=1 Tax=Penicillium egyptiacum TaxID=1303716 RepID=A0A9W4P381_9EURO|nr:unnamed protein product [Penicillium egyptiacum]